MLPVDAANIADHTPRMFSSVVQQKPVLFSCLFRATSAHHRRSLSRLRAIMGNTFGGG